MDVYLQNSSKTIKINNYFLTSDDSLQFMSNGTDPTYG